MTADVFAVPVFFICFRESLECAIIVSVLLAWLKQTIGPEKDPKIYKNLVRQIWWGIGVGVGLCLIIGGGMIGAFYGYAKDAFSKTEDIWEGTFSLIATVIITILGAALLRVSKLQDKWRVKLAQALEKKDQSTKRSAGGRFKRWCEKYSMFLLPFITVLREGLEAVVFIGGVGLSLPATAFPLAVVCGLAAGILVGYLIYRGGNTAKLQVFLIISTCFLYLIAAGLFSKAVWFFEQNAWVKITGGDAAETGSGPGSYNIRNSVWHVNCCNPLVNGGGGWGIFNAVLGWQNSATYGSVIAYNVYWIFIIAGFLAMIFYEKHGHYPLMKPRSKTDEEAGSDSELDNRAGGAMVEHTAEKADLEEGQARSSTVRELTV